MNVLKLLMFTGFDALEKIALRQQCLSIPQVVEKLVVIQGILEALDVHELDLLKFMNADNVDQLQENKHLLLATLGVQVGLFEHFCENHGRPHMLLGISLGDMARNVCAGVLDLKNAVIGILKFMHALKFIHPGSSMLIQLPQELSIELSLQKLNLEKYGLHLGVYQTTHQVLISGPHQELKKWAQEVAGPLAIVCKFAYPFPLHSPLMVPVAQELIRIMDKKTFADPQIPIFSTIFERPIKRREEFIAESVANISSTVNFYPSIVKILSANTDVQFINLGPSPLLNKFIFKMNLEKDFGQISVLNYFESIREGTMKSVLIEGDRIRNERQTLELS